LRFTPFMASVNIEISAMSIDAKRVSLTGRSQRLWS
jgi:hypothetical protein